MVVGLYLQNVTNVIIEDSTFSNCVTNNGYGVRLL